MPPFVLAPPAARAPTGGGLGRALARLAEAEEPVLRRIAAQPPTCPRAIQAVTALGSRPAAYTITLGSAVALARRDARQAHLAAIGTLVTGDLARELLCRRIGRERPPAELRHGRFTGASFPSRHATLAALTAAAVIEASPSRHRRAVAAFALAGCAGVGASRLRLGVHWPSDVAAGFAFAAGSLGLARAAARLPGRWESDVP
jgi:membrane-associated phospholipid phosphatase